MNKQHWVTMAKKHRGLSGRLKVQGFD